MYNVVVKTLFRSEKGCFELLAIFFIQTLLVALQNSSWTNYCHYFAGWIRIQKRKKKSLFSYSLFFIQSFVIINLFHAYY